MVSSGAESITVLGLTLTPVIWSGAIGAAVALFGAVVLGIFNAIHSSVEKSRDRTMALRKEVYLPLVASIPAAWGTLSKIPFSAEIDEKPLMEFAACAHKLVVVAETPTAILGTELSALVSARFLELMTMAVPAHACLSEANIAKEYRIKAGHKADLAQTKIDDHLQAGKEQDSNFEALAANQKFHHKQSQEYWATENAAIQKHLILSLAYIRKLVEVIPQLDAMRVKLMLSLRADIGLKTSVNEFKSSMDGQCSLIVNSLENFIENLEQTIQENNSRSA